MKQVVQNVRTGRLSVDEVPPPALRPEGILVRTRASLVSAGTERMVMKLARKSLLGKARQRPDLVRKVLQKMRRDGFLATFQAVQTQLDRQVPLGYSICGEVAGVGASAGRFGPRQLVACAGAGFANHAEVNYVPRLLAVPVPAGVSPEAAAYATVGAIALQGIRNADARVGETVVVLGLGLIGQLAVQVLKAAGCRVVGLDPDQGRVDLAASFGAELALPTRGQETANAVAGFTRGRGADAIIITAATTSNTPLELAAALARDRARVVMVGVTGMEIPRKPYYEKELSFVVSRSYGPGRYDPQYETHGHDYPPGLVRWTENRNLEAFLDLVASGAIRPDALTTHRFPIADAEAAFELVLTGREPYLGVVLAYPESDSGTGPQSGRIVLQTESRRKPTARVGVSFVGAGSFARSVLLPNLATVREVELRGVVTASGLSAHAVGRKFGFAFCASQADEVLDDPQTDAVFIATPHSQHADGVCRAVAAGKAVFCEKPLAISLDQLGQVRRALKRHAGALMVGFNRRFSPLAAELKDFLAGTGPLTVCYRCNAGSVPADHWIADPAEGGRIIGEGCHFIDFLAFLIDAAPVRVYAAAAGGRSSGDSTITVAYEDGSVGQLVYTSCGSPSSSKERVEVFAGGRTAVLEDFRRLHLDSGDRRRNRKARLRARKGHAEELAAFVRALRSGEPMPIGPFSLITTTLVTLAAVESARQGEAVQLAQLWRQLETAGSHSGVPPSSDHDAVADPDGNTAR